jgi:hypothetical protein
MFGKPYLLVLLTVVFALGCAVGVDADPKVRTVNRAIVVDANGKRVGESLAFHGGVDVTVVVGLKIGKDDYVLGVRPTNFTAPSVNDALAMFASDDCSGPGYISVSRVTYMSNILMMIGTVPIIAPKNPVADPTNETLWAPDTSSPPSVVELKSFWDTRAQDEDSFIIPPVCQTTTFGQLQAFPLVEVFNLSSMFTPPYSLKLIPD